jgi:ketosteroid isomerase-like protein
MDDLERRIQRLEDIEEIRQLVTRYGFIMDERDLEQVRQIFTPDATLRSKDGVFSATGIDTICETYQGRYDALGPTNHFVHGMTVDIDADDPDTARGLVSSHAEVVRDGVPMLVALRYEDVYRRYEGRWRLHDRLMSYMYYVPVTEYAEALGDDLRMRAYGDRRPADWPEVLVRG